MEKTPFPVVLSMMFVMMLVVVVIAPVMTVGGRLAVRAGASFGNRALNNLVQLASVQPDTPALRAIVDLDSLALRYIQRDHAYGAIHFFFLLPGNILCGRDSRKPVGGRADGTMGFIEGDFQRTGGALLEWNATIFFIAGADSPPCTAQIDAGNIKRYEKTGTAAAAAATDLLIFDKPDRDDFTLQTAQERRRNEVSW
jgi:hypothetical protein